MNTNYERWSRALVEVSPGYVIADRTLMSKKKFEKFLDEHGYKLLKWEQGTDPMCGREG